MTADSTLFPCKSHLSRLSFDVGPRLGASLQHHVAHLTFSQGLDTGASGAAIVHTPGLLGFQLTFLGPGLLQRHGHSLTFLRLT